MQLETLKHRSDFLRLNKSKKWTAHGLVLQVAENDTGRIRTGFTVTKKTEPSSARRNRIKRRLREAAKQVLPLYAKDSCDYVLIGRQQSATRPFQSLCADLRWCLEKTGYAKTADQNP